VDVLSSRHWLVSASADYTLRVWDLTSNLLLQTLLGHDDQVRRQSFDRLFMPASQSIRILTKYRT